MRVHLVRQQGQAALVQWHDGQTQRAYVPEQALYRLPGVRYRADEHEVDSPERGIPHGLPWAELVRLTVTPERVEAALRQFGLFTVEDIERNHVQALAALQSLYARDLADLIHSARAYRNRTHTAHEEASHG